MKAWRPLLAAVVALGGCSSQQSASGDPKGEVVVYVSEDQVFSEPILTAFEKETGIHVKAVYDTEEAKGAGVMNRLLAEAGNPQADVYWANEPVRAEVLRDRGILEPYHSSNAQGIGEQYVDSAGNWTGFSARLRVLVARKGLLKKPSGIGDYAMTAFKGRAAIANPLFGTTTAYSAALYLILGDEKAKRLFDDMKANGVQLTTSNGESADFVAEGKADFALVDSDDAFNRVAQGKAIEMIVPDQGPSGIGVMVVPNVAMMIKGGPNSINAKRFIDYLLSKETESKLAYADCRQIPLHAGVDAPKDVPKIESIRAMNLDFHAVAKKLQSIQGELKQWVGH